MPLQHNICSFKSSLSLKYEKCSNVEIWQKKCTLFHYSFLLYVNLRANVVVVVAVVVVAVVVVQNINNDRIARINYFLSDRNMKN